jgi:splicing factor U2AF subunit
MVSHEELEDDAEYNDIVEDIRAECSDHGSVSRVFIPRMKDGYPSSIEGFIFVEFYNSDMARLAAMALNGRKFADKFVEVQFVSFSFYFTIFFFHYLYFSLMR